MSSPIPGAVQAKPEAPALAEYYFKVVSSGSVPAGSEIPINEARIVLGSDPERANVVLTGDIKISGLHAFLQKEGLSYTLYDAESVSGTFVNMAQLTRGHMLVPGDKVKIGDTELSYHRRRQWGEGAKSFKEMIPDLMAVMVILALAAGLIMMLPQQPEPDLKGLTNNALDLRKALKRKDGYVEWDNHTFEEGLPIDKDRARKHYDRAFRCFRDRTLDPSNAFSAILEMRRAKAFSNNMSAAERPFDLEKAENLIKDARTYLDRQKNKYEKGFQKAYFMSDYDEASFCMRRWMSMFTDKYSDDKSAEYGQAEKRLAKMPRSSFF